MKRTTTLLLAAACSTNDSAPTDEPMDPTHDAEQLLCERFKECDLLLPTETAETCAGVVALCTDRLTVAEHEEWATATLICVELESCDDVRLCARDQVCNPEEP